MGVVPLEHIEFDTNMKNISFTTEEKAAMFDQIAKHYYDTNFGQMSKADMELLMFHYYLEKLISTNKSSDGTIEYSKCSDYIISKELGITQQRVRNLKIKKQLVYPTAFDWKNTLKELLKNARYDSTTKVIKMNIPDPNLFIEIQNFFEEKGQYIEKQLNNKILQIRAEYFFQLAFEVQDDKTQEEVIKITKNKLKEANQEYDFDDRKLGDILLQNAIDITTILANINSISSANPILKILFDLITK